MKKALLIAAVFIITVPALAQSAPAPTSAVSDTPKNWAVIVMTADVAKPVDVTWDRIGGKDYCAIIKYLGMNSCSLTVGSGDVGTNRVLNGTINELLVAKTAHSYSYAQPTSPIFYHGTMAVEPVDAGHSRIVYTLLYDNANIAPDARAAEIERRRVRFQGAVDKMKAAAEAP